MLNFGLAVGAGNVYQSDGGFFVKAEYNYLHFGTDAFPSWTNGAGQSEIVNITQFAHIFKVGIGFRF
jgi:opacity protein-like surface antigen